MKSANVGVLAYWGAGLDELEARYGYREEEAQGKGEGEARVAEDAHESRLV